MGPGLGAPFEVALRLQRPQGQEMAVNGHKAAKTTPHAARGQARRQPPVDLVSLRLLRPAPESHLDEMGDNTHSVKIATRDYQEELSPSNTWHTRAFGCDLSPMDMLTHLGQVALEGIVLHMLQHDHHLACVLRI